MSEKKSFDVSNIFMFLGLVFMAVLGIRTISTPEIWTHLALGRSNEALSFVESAPHINTTYLYDKLVYTVWEMGGPTALILIHTVALVASFWLLMQVGKRWGGGISQGFALLIAGNLLLPFLDVTPLNFMALFIAFFLYLLQSDRKPMVLWMALIPLQLLWTQMHGSFLFGPLIVVLSAIDAGQKVKGISARRSKKASLQPQLFALAGILLLLTLANPYVLGLHKQIYHTVFAAFPHYQLSLYKDYMQAPAHNPLIFFVMILGACGLITLKRKLPVTLTTLAVIGSVLVWHTLQAIQLFAVLTSPFVVLSFSAVGSYLQSSLGTMLQKREALLGYFVQGALAILMIFSIVPILTNSAYARVGNASTYGFGIEEELFPSGAEAILSHPSFPEKALNMTADGGYLAWKYPERKIFIDYRKGIYSRELLNNFQAMLLGNPKVYDQLIDQYRPEAIILNTLDPLAAQGAVTLLRKGLWKLVYFDGTTLILVLNKPQFSTLMENEQAQQAGLNQIEKSRQEFAAQLEKRGKAQTPGRIIGAARIFLAFNRPNEAKALFSLLLENNKTIAANWIGYGASQFMLRDFSGSIQSLEHAIRLSPANYSAWSNYYRTCLYSGNKEGMERAKQKMKALADEQRKEIEAMQKEAAEKTPKVDLPEEMKDGLPSAADLIDSSDAKE